MSDYIKKTFSKYISIDIKQKHINDIIQMVIVYGLRNEHPLALNTPLLGINKLHFTHLDQEALFEIFDYNKQMVTDVIKDIPSINKDWVVTSDAYNLFLLWVTYIIRISKKSLKDREKCIFSLFNMLQYKFFSSFINANYPYTPDEEIMRFTIENLTNKFDIVKYGTWRKVIFSRSEYFLNKSSIHYKTLRNFNNDKDILYVLSDIQTRVRSQIVNINILFYKNKEANNVIKSYSPIKDIDGLKIIKDIKGTTDIVNYNMRMQILNEDIFINDSYLKLMNSLYKNIKISIIEGFLRYVCKLAKEQDNDKNLIKIKEEKDFNFYDDINSLAYKIIRVIYEYCFNNNINIKSKLAIFQNAKKLLGSSRVQNKDILDIRNSIRKHILKSNISNRETTISSLTIIFGLYIIIKSFEFI